MYISAVAAYKAANIFNRAQAASVAATEKIASGKSFVSAASNPSLVGTVESLKSQRNEAAVIASLISPAKTELSSVSSRLEATLGRLELNRSQPLTADSLRDSLETLRSLSSFSNASGTRLFAGDKNQPTTITVNHDATNASLVSSAFSTVTLSASSFETEGGVSVGKSTLTVDTGSGPTDITINSGSYTVEELASVLNGALAGSGVEVAFKDDVLVFSNPTAGAESILTLGGSLASEIGAASTANGTDAWEESLPGPFADLETVYAQRSISFTNVDPMVAEIESLLTSGDLNAANDKLTQALGSLRGDLSEVSFTTSRFDDDAFNQLAKVERIDASISSLTDADPMLSRMELAKAQSTMVNASWALNQYLESSKEAMKTLLK